MSHFNIIQLMPEKDADRINENALYEDHYFHARCDYGGNEKEYAEVIDTIKRELRPVAFVNKRKRTITFKSKNSVREYLIRNARKAVNELAKTLRTGKGEISSDWALRSRLEGVGCCEDFFHLDYCRPLSDILLDYYHGYIPKTMYIGTILNGHF